MVKLVGSVCIFAAGLWVRHVRVSARRRELDTLSSLMSALGQMETEIRMARTPLPALLRRLGQSGQGPVGAFFRLAAEELQNGNMASWDMAAAELPLAETDRAVLGELGKGLRGDEESACRAIALSIKRLEDSRAAADGRLRPENERTTALCFSGAALLVILLI